MNNGTNFTDPSKEAAVVGAITTGLFDRIPERHLIPTRAFTDERWRIVYSAAFSLRSAGVPVCAERVSDLIAHSRLDGEFQKAFDSTKTFPWRNWPDHADQSAAFCTTTKPLEYFLEVLGELYEKREAAAVAKRMEAGELSREDAIKALREIGPETRGLPSLISAFDLCAHPPPTPPEIIEGILHQGSKMMLGGGSKSFKTWTQLEIAICVATGRDWLGFSTTKGRVLYVNFELPAFAIEKRVKAICDAMSIEIPKDLVFYNLRGYAASADIILPIISREARAGNFNLSFLDPLYKLLGGREENSNTEMANLMNDIERLTVEADLATVFGSHFAKGNASSKESMDRVSGAGVFARDPDSIVTLTAHEEDKAFCVEMTLRNFPPQEKFVVRRQHPLMVIDMKLDPEKLKKPKGGRVAIHSADDVLARLDGSMTDTAWKQACNEYGIGSTTYYEHKKVLHKEGRVFQSAIDQKWGRKP